MVGFSCVLTESIRLKRINNTIIALTMLLVCTQVAATDANNIRLKSFANADVSLSSHIQDGKVTLLMIWATNCPPCEEQKPMIQKFHSDYQSTKAQVVGVVIDGFKDLDEVNRLIEKEQPTYTNFVAEPSTLLTDFRLATGKQFIGAPTYIMFDDKGNTLAVAMGPITRAQLDAAVSQ